MEPDEYTYQTIHVTDHGVTDNGKFFLGRLPAPGEAVEMIFIGETEEGAMRFQLRVKEV